MARAQNINPMILIWARETAGFSVEEAAQQLGLSGTKAASAAEKLAALERGEKKPTRNQLLKIAAVYRRPVTAFYMQAPPNLASRGEDFRTLPGPVSPRDNALLDALLRDIRARQDMVRSILEDDEDAKELDFVGSVSIHDNVQETAGKLRAALAIETPRDLRSFNGIEALFNELRTRTERLGVFVLLIGNLGSHHTNISEEVFRGFAIADKIAPFIVINDQDAKVARSFTLIHELVHIFVGSTGVSGSPAPGQPMTSTERIERFCNDVASEFLLPSDALPGKNEVVRGVEHQEIRQLAELWNISEPMVAYRFHRSDLISDATYRELIAMYARRWKEHRKRVREQNREGEGGPNYYTVRKHRLGQALIGLVGRSLRENELTHTKAAKMLGVKPSSVEPLVRSFEPVSGYIPNELRR